MPRPSGSSGKSLGADNGAGRFPYQVGGRTLGSVPGGQIGPPLPFGGSARGWFSAGMPEKALILWPALPVGMGSAYSSRSERLDIVWVLYAGLDACQACKLSTPRVPSLLFSERFSACAQRPRKRMETRRGVTISSTPCSLTRHAPCETEVRNTRTESQFNGKQFHKKKQKAPRTGLSLCGRNRARTYDLCYVKAVL